MGKIIIILIGLSFLTSSCSTQKKSEKLASASGASNYSGLGSESVTLEMIQKFAPPALPKEMSRKIQSYLDLRAPGLGMLSKDKSQLFFSWRVTGVSQIWRLNGPNQFPIQMTGGEDDTRLQDISPDGKFLIISRDRSGEENPGLYLQSVDGGSLFPIQHKEKIQTLYAGQLPLSKKILYRSNDVKPDSYAIYTYDLVTKKSNQIFSQDGFWFVADIHPSEKKILLGKALSNVASEYFELNLSDSKLTPILGQNEKTDYTVVYSNKENEFLVSTNKFGEFHRLYRYKNTKFDSLSREMAADVSAFVVNKQKTRLIYQVNNGGFTQIYGADLQSGKSISLPDFPQADHVYQGSFSLDGDSIMLAIESSSNPRTGYSYDFKTKKITQWVYPSSPEINTKNFSRATLEHYPTKDGEKIPVFVRRPPLCVRGKTVCPVVLHFHGGPEAQSTPGFNLIAQMFVDAGFVFAEPNVRGSEGYGKSWLDRDNGPKRLEVISDISDAAIYFSKIESSKDKKAKVGVMGWSYGGYSTLMAMTKFSDYFDAGVALVGMSNLVTFLQNTAPYRRALRMAEYGNLETDRDSLFQLSPVTYIDKAKNPILIIQGVSDPRVPVGEAIQMKEELAKRRVDSELILFADEGHGASKRSNQVLELGHTLQFFVKNLKK